MPFSACALFNKPQASLVIQAEDEDAYEPSHSDDGTQTESVPASARASPEKLTVSPMRQEKSRRVSELGI